MRTGIRGQSLISPDNWNMDVFFLQRPGARKVLLDFFYELSH